MVHTSCQFIAAAEHLICSAFREDFSALSIRPPAHTQLPQSKLLKASIWLITFCCPQEANNGYSFDPFKLAEATNNRPLSTLGFFFIKVCLQKQIDLNNRTDRR